MSYDASLMAKFKVKDHLVKIKELEYYLQINLEKQQELLDLNEYYNLLFYNYGPVLSKIIYQSPTNFVMGLN
jgi:protein associated with RNAse G/E